MADLLDLLGDALDDRGVAALAKALDLDVADATKLIGAALPVLLEQLDDNAKKGDADNIALAVTKDHDGTLLDDAATFLGGRFSSGPGMSILNHVFGDQLDASIAQVAASTGIPSPVVRLGFSALAPLVLGAITKAAIGAVTAVVVVKLLDVAIDQVRSGRAQQLVGRLNRSLDDDGDGNAIDDVGRGAVGLSKRVGSKIAGTTATVARSKRTRRVARKTAKVAKKSGVAIAKKGGSLAKKGFRRFRKRF